MQIIFQDSVGSLDPRMRVRDIVGEGLAVHGVAGSERAERVVDALERVGLGAETLRRYPHQFSGGQRQRIGIARALVLRPKLVVADEPVSALDVSIQSQVLNLLVELKQAFGLTYLFVAHDLAVVGYISDRIAVMYLGKVVELAPAAELFARPLHPYTVALLSAIPTTEPGRKRSRITLSGDVPSPMNPPSGCHFRTRCPIAQPICAEVEPPLADHGQSTRRPAISRARRSPSRSGTRMAEAGSTPRYEARLLHDQRVPTRDGITLSADVYLPLAEGPFPTIVQWTPYESTRERFIGWGVFYAQRGYAAIVVDMRGRYESGGELEPWVFDGVDAQDTLTWAAGEQWCNGRIGTWGRSYGGVVQWQLAHLGHPNLQCIAPHVIHDDYFWDGYFTGGAFQLALTLGAAALWDSAMALITGPERGRPDPERPRLPAPAADRPRRGHDRAQGRLLARTGGSTRQTTTTGTSSCTGRRR